MPKPSLLKVACVLVVLALLLGLLLMAGRSRQTSVLASSPAAADFSAVGFRLRLGLGDEQPRDWSGSIAVSSGRLTRFDGWHFAGDDRVDGQSWQAASKKPAPGRAATVATPPLVEPLGILPVGVQGVIAAPAAARVSVTTKNGNFAFDIAGLAYGRPLKFLDGAAMVERQPVTERLTTPEFEDDYPSVAVTRDGAVWVAWIGYKERADHVFVRCYKNGRWSDPLAVSPAAGDFFGTAMAEDASGRLWVVWSAQEKGNWELQARSIDARQGERGKWSAVARLTSNPGPDIFHSLAAGKDGRLALAWMSFREGQADIYLKTFDGSRWSEEVKVSESPANDWEPSVAVDSAGTAWVAWDSYERGSYNVLLRSVADGKPGELVRVTDSPRYHARASVAADARNRIWVAWEESEANWGKDYGFWVTSTPWQGAGNPLYRSRAARVAVLDNKVLKTPARELMEAVPLPLRQYAQMPQLLADAAGRVWALLRIRSFVRTETADVWASGGRWNVYLTMFDGGEWLPPIPFPDSVARNYARSGAALAPDGKLWVAWPSDQRLFGNAPPAVQAAAAKAPPSPLQGFGAVPQNYDVFAAAVDPAALAQSRPALRDERAVAAGSGPLPNPAGRDGSVGELVLLRPDSVAAVPVHPEEDADLARIRGYEIRSGGKAYRIYRGDMHRHTDISADGAGDGSFMDLFRYALDAARMDYAMVTDHNSGFDQEYSWWRIEKADDLFNVPGGLITLFGYERSLPYPNGHRNVAFAQRGVRTLPAAPGEQGANPKVNSGSVLYPYLRQNRGIAFGHTSATGMGTDWRDNDAQLEPLVEIYQGMRTSAEYEGAPKAPTADNPVSQQGGFRPAGFVWNAWAKGYKLGVQASSDHISTHISYSCVISEDRSREGLMNAMRKRHAYAATDNIILDVRMQDGANEYIQGDALAATKPPRLVVKVLGTRPIKDIQVIKNNRFVYSQKPNVKQAEFAFADTDVQPGESYYYVRVVQDNEQIAWSSPIWVTYK